MELARFTEGVVIGVRYQTFFFIVPALLLSFDSGSALTTWSDRLVGFLLGAITRYSLVFEGFNPDAPAEGISLSVGHGADLGGGGWRIFTGCREVLPRIHHLPDFGVVAERSIGPRIINLESISGWLFHLGQGQDRPSQTSDLSGTFRMQRVIKWVTAASPDHLWMNLLWGIQVELDKGQHLALVHAPIGGPLRDRLAQHHRLVPHAAVID